MHGICPNPKMFARELEKMDSIDMYILLDSSFDIFRDNGVFKENTMLHYLFNFLHQGLRFFVGAFVFSSPTTGSQFYDLAITQGLQSR